MMKLVSLALVITLLGCAHSTKDVKTTKTVSPDKVPKIPKVSGAEVKTLWIPDKVSGNRWEEGHYLHIIDKPSTWHVE